MTDEACKHKQNHVAVVCRNEELITRLRKAADNNCLDIGAAWNLLDEAADALLATVGCTDAYIASRNLAEAAEQFEIERRIVFVNVMAE